MKLTKEMLKQMVAEELESLLRPEEDEEEPLEEGEDPTKVAQFCSKRGFYALNRLLTIQNNLAKAAKGDLGKK